MNESEQKHEAFFNNDTPQELLNETAKKVESLLEDNFESYLKFDNNSYTISYGSCQVMIIVRPYTDKETNIEFMSQVATESRITPELMNYLLRKNAELHFGGFGLLFDNTITFNYSIPGSSVNPEAFKLALNTVAIIADYYDDIIVEMAGGKRAADAAEIE